MRKVVKECRVFLSCVHGKLIGNKLELEGGGDNKRWRFYYFSLLFLVD